MMIFHSYVSLPKGHSYIDDTYSFIMKVVLNKSSSMNHPRLASAPCAQLHFLDPESEAASAQGTGGGTRDPVGQTGPAESPS